MADIIDLLLKPEKAAAVRERQTAEYEVKRLSKALGEPFVVKLRGMGFGQFMDLSESREPLTEIPLEGIVSPNLRDPRLLEAYKVPTPADLLKVLFLPGELAEIRGHIERLTGFRATMLQEVKKN